MRADKKYGKMYPEEIYMQKIVLITGATSGYGLAAAKKFKAEGYTVLIASRNAEKVERIVTFPKDATSMNPVLKNSELK